MNETATAAHETLTGSGYIALLRTNRNYRRLWLAQAVSELGDWFNLVAVVAIVLRYAGVAEALSGLLVVRMAPLFLLGPFAGVLADRFNRRTLMIVADLARAVTVLGFLLVQGPAQIWLVYALTLLQFTLAALFEPARGALIPAVTAPGERIAANALGALTWSVLLAAGAALGGVTAGLVGPQAAFVVDALSFLGSAVLVAAIPRAIAQPAANPGRRVRLGADLAEGFSYLRNRPAVLAYTLIKPLGALSSGAYFTIIALQAKNVYPLGQDGALSLGLLNLAIGAGSGLGPVLGSRLLRRMGETRANLQILIALGFILIGLGYALFVNMTVLPIAALCIIVAELGSGGQWVFSTTLIQASVADGFRGRVAAVELAMMTAANIVAVLASGVLLDQFHVTVPDLGLGLFLLKLAIGLTWLIVAVRLARPRLTPPDPAPLGTA
jgi:MFS family permease